MASDTVSDIKKLRDRFEQRPLIQVRPSVKPKTATNGSLPNLPAKTRTSQIPDNAAPPVIPNKQSTPSDGKGKPKNLPKVIPDGVAPPLKSPRPGPVTYPKPKVKMTISSDGKPTYTRVELEKMSVRIKDTDNVMGADGKMYKKLPKPSSNIVPAPQKVKRPTHILLPSYAGEIRLLPV